MTPTTERIRVGRRETTPIGSDGCRRRLPPGHPERLFLCEPSGPAMIKRRGGNRSIVQRVHDAALSGHERKSL